MCRESYRAVDISTRLFKTTVKIDDDNSDGVILISILVLISFTWAVASYLMFM